MQRNVSCQVGKQTPAAVSVDLPLLRQRVLMSFSTLLVIKSGLPSPFTSTTSMQSPRPVRKGDPLRAGNRRARRRNTDTMFRAKGEIGFAVAVQILGTTLSRDLPSSSGELFACTKFPLPSPR